MTYPYADKSIMLKIPGRNFDSETWRKVSRRTELGFLGILEYTFIELLHQLEGLWEIIGEFATIPKNYKMRAFPTVVKPSWVTILQLNYSRPPNSQSNIASNNETDKVKWQLKL